MPGSFSIFRKRRETESADSRSKSVSKVSSKEPPTKVVEAALDRHKRHNSIPSNLDSINGASRARPKSFGSAMEDWLCEESDFLTCIGKEPFERETLYPPLDLETVVMSKQQNECGLNAQTPDGKHGLDESNNQGKSLETQVASSIPGHNRRRSSTGGCLSAVESLEDLLCWTDTWKSARVCFGGLYLLICIKVYLEHGVNIVQPSTVLLGTAFLMLLCNSVVKLRPVLHPFHNYGFLSSSELHLDEEVFLEKIAYSIAGLGQKAAGTLPPLIALVARHLSASKRIPAFYLGLYLWSLMLIGESQILSQMGVLILAYGSMFVLPNTYLESQWVLDNLAVTLWESVLGFSKEEYRKELYFSAAVGGGVVYLFAGGIIWKLTVGAVCFALILIIRVVYFAS